MNPLDPQALALRRATAKKLYGAIVAQARLPVFYRSFGLPDTAGPASLHLFAMLHRLKHEGAEGRAPAQEILPPPLVRTLRVDEVKDGKGALDRGHEREAIVSLLDLIALDRLSFVFLISPAGQGRLALQGTLSASTKQTCVVSLDPVASPRLRSRWRSNSGPRI